MNVKSVEKTASNATLVIEIAKADLEPALNKVYLKYRKDITVPGFRKGKAPRTVIEAAYGKHVFYEDAVEELFGEVYAQCVQTQEFKTVGKPNVTNMAVTEDNGVELTVVVDLYPEVTLGQYKGLEVEKMEVKITDAEIEAELDRMAQNVARISTVEGPAEMGHTAVIDFEGFKDGVAFEGGKGENFELKLGSGSFIPGFEEQVVGMSAGQEKDLDVTFPESYHAAELAGKAVVFKVKVHEVKQTVVPAKDDDFVKDVSEFDTMEQLREDISKRLAEQKQGNVDRAFENAVIAKAVANMTVEVPASMIEAELDQQFQRMDYELRSQGASLEDYAKMMGGNLDAMRSSLRPGAENSVKTNLMLEAVGAAENIVISDEDCEAEYAKMAENYQMEIERIKGLVVDSELKHDLMLRKAAELVAASAVALEPKAQTEE